MLSWVMNLGFAATGTGAPVGPGVQLMRRRLSVHDLIAQSIAAIVFLVLQ